MLKLSFYGGNATALEEFVIVDASLVFLILFLLLQIAKGNFTYNYGDYGNIIVMLEPRKPTKTLL